MECKQGGWVVWRGIRCRIYAVGKNIRGELIDGIDFSSYPNPFFDQSILMGPRIWESMRCFSKT